MSTATTEQHWIKALQRTPFKPESKQLKDIDPSLEVVFANPGETFAITTFREDIDKHWVVTSGDPKFPGMGEKSVYENHWVFSWNNDGDEKEPDHPLNIVSQLPDTTAVGARLTPGMPFDTRITAHITYGEFAKYQEARRLEEDHQCRTAYEICLYLEKVRAHFGGRPLVLTSGFRPRFINSRVGGSRFSEHLYDKPGKGAVDFYIKGVSIFDVEKYCDETWDYSLGYGAKRGFVHLGMRPGKPRVRWIY